MKRKVFRKAISVLLALTMLFTLCTPAFAADNETDKTKLRFGADGKFKILVISDTQDTYLPVTNMLTLIQRSLDESNPDLVVFLGDQLKNYDSDFDYGNTEFNVETALHYILAPVERRKIPFAVVFGNHDGGVGVSKEEQVKIYQKYNGCLMVDEGDDVPGVGNYNVPIYSSKDSSKIAYNFYFMDSHSGHEETYESLTPEQVEWYVNTSNALKAQNGGKVVPSMQFQHIPLPAFKEICESDKITLGENAEEIAGPDTDSGFQLAMEKQGDVVMAVCGHNHNNTFIGSLNGIDYCFTPGCGFNEYGRDMERAVREIVIDENSPREYETRLLTFIDLLGDTPVTHLRFKLLTVGELDGNPLQVIPEVIGLFISSIKYELEIHKGNHFDIIPDILEFCGADISYIRNHS